MFIAYYLSSCDGFKICSQILCISFLPEVEFLTPFPLSVAWIQWLASNTQNMGRSKEVWLPRLGHKKHCKAGGGVTVAPSCPLSWITRSGESHLPCHENTALRRGLRPKKLRCPVNNEQRPESSCQRPGEWTVLEVDPPDSVKPLEHSWQTPGPRVESGPAPCFYPAAAPSSRLTVQEQLHVHSPQVTFGSLKATTRLMWPRWKWVWHPCFRCLQPQATYWLLHIRDLEPESHS